MRRIIFTIMCLLGSSLCLAATAKTEKSAKPHKTVITVTNQKKIEPVAPLTLSEQLFIRRAANHYHLKQELLNKVLHEAQYREKVLELIKHPYESKPWDTYRDFLITPKRINDGLKFWKKYSDTLQYVQDQYHVPAKIIAGILGVETDYGTKLGKFRVLDALTTLSFYYPSRTKFFRSQLAQFILYCQQNHIDPSSIMGSYAGAIGQPQFMPSNILYYGVDNSKKGSIDLTNDEGDVIASIANFLGKNGWEENQPIAILARANNIAELHWLLGNFNPTMTIAEWELHGIRPTIPVALNLRATLMPMPVKNGYEYWLIFDNFNIIKTYNNSDNYALAVTMLGTRVEEAYKQWKRSSKSH